MQESKLSRKEREFQRHREEILDTALELFSKNGYHSVTMQKIAQESEFAVGTIYKFFPNKETLYEAIILENYDHWHFSLMETVNNNTRNELECIRNYVETHIRLFKENLEFVRLYLRLYYAETRGGGYNIRPDLRAEIKKKNDEILKKLAKLFEKGMRKNIFKRLEAYHLAMAIEAITHAFSRHYFETREEESFKTDIIMKVFLESILKDQPSKG